MKNYKITGVVYGKLWGGGAGAYPSEELQGNDLTKLMTEAKKLLKTGGLDSGMGYERLTGAYLTVETKTKKTIAGKDFFNTEYDDLFIGDLTQEEKDFLQFDCSFN